MENVSKSKNASCEFINYYKPAGDQKVTPSDNIKYENQQSKITTSSGKKKKAKNTALGMPQLSFGDYTTPRRSIIKTNLSEIQESIPGLQEIKPKKRNKSVSFMLESDEVKNKKAKSEDTSGKKQKFHKRLKENYQNEKENKNIEKQLPCTDHVHKIKKKSKNKNNVIVNEGTTHEGKERTENILVNEQTERKVKKAKKKKKAIKNLDDEPLEVMESFNTDMTTENELIKPDPGDQNQTEISKANKKHRKNKKREHSLENLEIQNTEQSDSKKMKKKKKSHFKSDSTSEQIDSQIKVKPEVIVENLENLKIGDNPHTLTAMLDEMTVADKNKRSKINKKIKKSKKSAIDKEVVNKSENDSEKMKWSKRKWNKDRIPKVHDDVLAATVIVDNLPISCILNYKKLLNEHFGKLGIIKKIGVAEVYPTEVFKPVFSTTIQFYSDGAAAKALEEDNTLFEGAHIRLRAIRSPMETIVVIRSYGELTEQCLSSIFTNAGRVRSIRLLTKSRKLMNTAFVEFDGPEAVEKAIKMADEVKIGGKKIYVSNFELRTKMQSDNTSESMPSDT